MIPPVYNVLAPLQVEVMAFFQLLEMENCVNKTGGCVVQVPEV